MAGSNVGRGIKNKSFMKGAVDALIQQSGGKLARKTDKAPSKTKAGTKSKSGTKAKAGTKSVKGASIEIKISTPALRRKAAKKKKKK
jgi:hypothetical protein